MTEKGVTVSQIKMSPMVKPFGATSTWYTLCWRWHLTTYKYGRPYGVAELGLGLNHKDAIIYASSGIHLTKIYSIFATVSNNGIDIKWNIKLLEGLEAGIIYSNFDLIKPTVTYHFIPRGNDCVVALNSINNQNFFVELITNIKNLLSCNQIITKKKTCDCKCCCKSMAKIFDLPFFVTVAWDTNTAPYIGIGLHL